MSLRACYQLIACLLHRSHRPHTSLYAWTDAAKQRAMVYLSGRGQRGQMFLPPGTDNPSYATVSSLQCKCGHFSLPLYRKQERSLFTATLEQRSNVPTAHDVGRMTDHPAASNGRPVDLPYLRAGRLSHSHVASQPVFWQVCRGAGDLAAAHQQHTHLPATSTIMYQVVEFLWCLWCVRALLQATSRVPRCWIWERTPDMVASCDIYK